MNRWVVAVAVVFVVACGNKQEPRIGSNDPNNENNATDMDTVSIFPDVRVSRDRGTVDPPDDGPAPDVRDNVDGGPDLADEPDLGVDTGPDMTMLNCPRTDVVLGAPCRCNQECTSGVCVDASVTIDGFCSTACTQRGDCRAGEACVTDRFGDSVCRPDDTGANCTAAGQPNPESCSAGHCVQAGSNFAIDYFCSVPCTNSADCAMGHACSPARCQYDPTTGYSCLPNVVARRAPNPTQVLIAYPEATKVCIKVGDPNPCGAQTMSSDEQACAGSMCDAAPTGRCTAPCASTADCPAGGCVDYDVTDPTLPIRICDL